MSQVLPVDAGYGIPDEQTREGVGHGPAHVRLGRPGLTKIAADVAVTGARHHHGTILDGAAVEVGGEGRGCQLGNGDERGRGQAEAWTSSLLGSPRWNAAEAGSP
jgi:hypothetical protein